MTKILVIGATSTIAQQVARLLCREGVEIHLLGRDQVKLNDITADLQVRGVKVSVNAVDLNDLAVHQKIIGSPKNLFHMRALQERCP